MNDIFISYQWNIKDEVHEICDLLESKNKYKLWIDKNKTRFGGTQFTDIENGIKNSKIFIGFVTKAYCGSENCKREIQLVNSLTGDNKKMCIYVILDENIDTNTDGVDLLIAGSLMLNAFDHVNKDKLDTDKVYNLLSIAIDACLNKKALPDDIMGSVLIDLKNLIKCSSCKQFYNLLDEHLPDCAKPMLTSCNKVVCYTCYNNNKLENGQYICPFDHNEHVKPTNAVRLHAIIEYFDTLKSFTSLKKDTFKYKFKSGFIKQQILVKVNETKKNIKEHIEQIIADLNKYLSEMLTDLDKYVTEWNERQESIKESLNLDETIKVNEASLSKIENNLKQIEISVSNHKLLEELKASTHKDLAKLETDIEAFNDRVMHENESIKGDSFLIYKKGRGIHIDLGNIIGGFERKDLIFDESYVPSKYGNTIKELGLEIFQNDEMGKYLKTVECEKRQLKRNVQKLNNTVKMLTSKYCVCDEDIIELCKGQENNYHKLQEKLKEKNYDVNHKNKDGETALIIACEKGHKEIAELLIENGAILDEKDSDGRTALMSASWNGHKEVVQLLIENGGVVNEKDNYGSTVLMFATWNDQREVAELLISKGAIINEKDNYGSTVLMFASQNGHKKVTELLINNGAIVNEKDNDGWTALIKAAWKGHKEVAKLLVDNGAFVNEKNCCDWTALMLTSQNGYVDVAKLLVEYGAVVNGKNSFGWTALMLASWNGHKEIAKFLIDNGAFVNEKDNYGSTALLFAFNKNHKEVAQFLFDNGATLDEDYKHDWFFDRFL